MVRQYTGAALSLRPRMKILHLSKMDTGGGAADGFVRIHQALLGQGVESVAYVLKQKRRDVPMVAAKGLLNPWQKLVWGLGRAIAKVKRFGVKPVGVYDFDAEANFPAEPIIRHARARSAKWDLVLVHWSGGFVRPETVREIAQALSPRVPVILYVRGAPCAIDLLKERRAALISAAKMDASTAHHAICRSPSVKPSTLPLLLRWERPIPMIRAK